MKVYGRANRKKIAEYHKQWFRKWYHQNKEAYLKKKKDYKNSDKNKTSLRQKKWVSKNKEKLRLCRERNKEKYSARERNWRLRNQERIRNRRRERRRNDVNYVIILRLRARLSRAVRQYKTHKSASTKELLGCSCEYLRGHIESLFKPGMSWENRSEWHIDHKRPVASYDLTDPLQQRECFHYANLQPLWKKENMSKGSRHHNSILGRW